MPERDVPSPGLDWTAFQKRTKPPPLRYWGTDIDTRKPKFKKVRKPSTRTNMKKVRLLDPICRYCMKAPTTTADHVFPKSRGGSNRLVNLVGSCQPCNVAKADQTPKEAGMKLHLPLRFFSYLKEKSRFE